MFSELRNLLEVLCTRSGIAWNEEVLTLSQRELGAAEDRIKELEYQLRQFKAEVNRQLALREPDLR